MRRLFFNHSPPVFPASAGEAHLAEAGGNDGNIGFSGTDRQVLALFREVVEGLVGARLGPGDGDHLPVPGVPAGAFGHQVHLQPPVGVVGADVGKEDEYVAELGHFPGEAVRIIRVQLIGGIAAAVLIYCKLQLFSLVVVLSMKQISQSLSIVSGIQLQAYQS